MMRYISKEYLSYMTRVIEHFEVLSTKFLGYELKQILLLHANTLNADYLDQLIQIFRVRNYVFISLDEALNDPAYLLEDAVSTKGLSWIHRWMLAKNLPLDPEPDTPDEILQLNKSY